MSWYDGTLLHNTLYYAKIDRDLNFVQYVMCGHCLMRVSYQKLVQYMMLALLHNVSVQYLILV